MATRVQAAAVAELSSGRAVDAARDPLACGVDLVDRDQVVSTFGHGRECMRPEAAQG